jgi:hypothetical protein
MRAAILPKPGDRVGFVYGPGSFPRDSMGIVIATFSDKWYDNQCLILMDDGEIRTKCGTYTDVGIGCYLIRAAKEIAA